MVATVIVAIIVTIVTFANAQVSRDGHARFADSLTAELHEDPNECTSSWGVSLVFDLLYPGGAHTTQTDLCNVISLCAQEPQQQLLWKDAVNRLTTAYDGRCVQVETTNGKEGCRLNAPTLEIANSVWIHDEGRQLAPDYNEVVGEFLMQTDFTAEQAGAVVNAWVNATTRGLIDSIVEDGPLFPPFVLLAINSIYLEATWSTQFETRYTNTDLFYTSPTRQEASPKMANFMHLVEFFQYSHDALPGYQVIQLPYAHSSLSMVFVLPTSSESKQVTSVQVLDVLPLLQSQRVALALPRFKFESKYQDNLKNALKALQLESLFTCSGGNGFDSLFDSGGCQFVNLIVQKTIIDVNELGTIAAAVTLAGLIESSAPTDVPVLLLANHAFSFFLLDQDEELVLFEGRVGAPEIVNEPAELQDVHSDADFWTKNFGVDPTEPPDTSKASSNPMGMSSKCYWFIIPIMSFRLMEGRW